MRLVRGFLVCLLGAACARPTPAPVAASRATPARLTRVGIRNGDFTINGRPTYEGRTYRGMRVEGLLMNARMVQGTFDDLNPDTRGRWAYPDTGTWDAERNTRELLAAMPLWRRQGLLAITLNLQGGSPEGYSKTQPWHNSAFTEDGSLRPDFMARLEKILDRADQLRMVVILGYFYFGQDQRLRDEAAVLRGTDAATAWLTDRGYTNVVVEIANETDGSSYDHPILKPAGIVRLIDRVKAHGGGRLTVGTSLTGGRVPDDAIVRASDVVFLHGNGVSDPERIAAMVVETRARPSYRGLPIVFNEDDHFDFDQPSNNMLKAVGAHASWGYFDPGKSNYRDGYQCPPVSWGIDTDRKRAFFEALAAVTGTGRVFPEADWEEASPEAQGLDAATLSEAVAHLVAHAPRDGADQLVVVRHGYLVWKGKGVDQVHGVWSMTKSFTSTVLGLLVGDGKAALEDRASKHLPALQRTYPDVTLRHFTTMTSGYRAVRDEPRGSYTHGPSPTPFVPAEVPLFAPGTKYAYWDSAMNEFANILTRIAGEPMKALFARRVADPIGMAFRWGDFGEVDGLLINGGSGNENRHVSISARQIARLGWLFLNQGRWKGAEVVGPAWVKTATSVQVPSQLPLVTAHIDGRGVYGCNWWTNGINAHGTRRWPSAPATTFAASGANNNMMFIVPEWDMVVVRLGLDGAIGKGFDIDVETWDAFLGHLKRAIVLP